MVGLPAALADRGEVEHALRRVYPTGVLDELDPDALDQDLTSGRLEELLDGVASTPGVNAVLEPEIVRSHILHVGLDGAPDWERLNRVLSLRDRHAAVSGREGGIVYWNILLSRVGPFWTDRWNVFRSRGGQVFPEVAGAPADPGWSAVRRRVRGTLLSFGMREVEPRLRDASVGWLAETRSEASAPPGSGRRVTVYDALFSDVY